MWNGRPFERHTTIAKPVRIFTVSHSPKVERGNTKWAHANDHPLLILEGEADGVAPFEEAIPHTPVIPLMHDTGQHDQVLQTDFGGLACDAEESAVGAVQETIVEATVGE